MATMLSGAAIMDAALLVIAANEKCPQPQTKEHLMALEIIGVKNIIIVQNKIDLIEKEEVVQNYKDIKNFIKGTIAKDAPIIPVSAQHNVNIDILVETIEKTFKTPKRDLTKDPIMFIARSFDINKPGSDMKNFVGGVLGGALKHGSFKLNDKIEIKPGLKIEKEGKEIYQPIETEVAALKTGNLDVKKVTSGGSIGVLTKLDPAIVKSDNLSGNIAGLKGKLPKVYHEFTLKQHLLKRVVGAKEDLLVDPIKINENLMLNVNSAATIGTVTKVDKEKIHVNLKIPVCADTKEWQDISG
jgi:translation initiation factor 2 subunit 3